MPSFDELEQELLATAARDLEVLPIAKAASDALASVLAGTSVETAPESAPASWYARAALYNLGAIALRSARAAILLISAGYEPDAHGMKRRLSEVHALAQAIIDDKSGQRARDFLEGKPPRHRSLAHRYGSQELYDTYSQSDHADLRGSAAWLMIPMPERGEHARGIRVEPHRRTDFANGMLTEVAMETRDLAQVLALAGNGRIEDLAELDTRIHAAIERWYAPPEPAAEDD